MVKQEGTWMFATYDVNKWFQLAGMFEYYQVDSKTESVSVSEDRFSQKNWTFAK